MRLKSLRFFLVFAFANSALAEEMQVFLEDANGARLEIATLVTDDAGNYSLAMAEQNFTEHFLSMRPFKCLEGHGKHWCHIPYPYTIARNISSDLTDLEYDLLFVWKDANDYGINLWNGVYYRLTESDGKLFGLLHEMDMNILAVPPADGNLRPIQPGDLHPSDTDSHWLPVVVIEPSGEP